MEQKAGQGDASHKVLAGAGARIFRNVLSVLKMDNYSGFFKEKIGFSVSGEHIHEFDRKCICC